MKAQISSIKLLLIIQAVGSTSHNVSGAGDISYKPCNTVLFVQAGGENVI